MVSKLVSALHSLAPLAYRSVPGKTGLGKSLGKVTAMALLAAPAAALLLAHAAGAQAPIPFPYTITTVAGGGATITAGSTCSTGSQYKAADTYGNGCPGAFAQFSNDLRGGLTSDGLGNIYIADTNNTEVRRYDPKSTLVTRVAGGGTNCTTGLLDSVGDGCPAQSTTLGANHGIRGINIDPYGNILLAGYGYSMVNVICQAASPLCPAGVRTVGNMYRVAGCVASTASAGTGGSATATNATAGSEGDNTFASPYENSAAETGAGIAGTSSGGTCSTAVGTVTSPRGAGADRYGNVYIAETGSGSITSGAGLRYRVVLGPQTYNGVTNPLWAVINGTSYTPYASTTAATYTAHQGYMYTILGGFAGVPSAKGGACGAYTAEDALGDGCPFQFSSANGGEQGVTTDNFGNAIFSDTVNSVIRVLYVGGTGNPLAAAIVANSSGTVTTPVAGNVYLLAGKGSTAISATATLGSATTLSNQAWKVQVGPGGNLYFGDASANSVYLYDITTGYIRQIFKSGTACAAHVTGATNGDGCPASQSSFSGGGAGLGIAVDPLGNLYLGDTETSSPYSLLRKVEAVSLIPTIVGSTTSAGAALTQTLQFHGPVGTGSITASVLNQAADIAVGTATCAAANADGTMECTVPVTFAPTQPGPRTANLLVSALNSAGTVLGSQVFAVSGSGIGSALVTDTAAPTTSTVTAAGVTPVGVAVDGAGNLYTVDTASATVRKLTPAGASTSVGASPANPGQVSVDTAGNVYVASTSGAATRYALSPSGTYTAGTFPTALTGPRAIVYDASGNAYVADTATAAVYEIPATTNFVTLQPTVAIATGFTTPVGLALDGQGNLFVADSGAPAVYKIANVNGVITTSAYAASGAVSVTATPGATAASTAPTVTVTGLVPVAIAADAAGNVNVQDSTARAVTMIPVAQAGPATTAVLSGLTTPSGVAVDGNGVVYSADSGAAKLTRVARNALVFNFGTSTSTVFSGIVTNAGNLTATGFQATGLDSGDFPITSVSPTNCFNATAIIPGYACSLTSQFTPGSGTGTVSSTLAFTVASSTTGSLQLTAIKTGAAVTTTTTIGTQSPANAVYSASATEITFPITVAASDGSTPSGALTVSVDSGAPVAYTLSGGATSVPLSGLTAGSHTLVAMYATQGGLTGSTSSTATFTIAQATTTVNWAPSATTQQYSAAIGAGVLDASAVVTGTSTAVPGYFLYAATASGGSAATVHSASYLPLGTYTLSVTFVPIDTTDYVGSSSMVAGYTVTRATTTASLGATQNLVAADGSGNFTTVQAAVNTIPATGGGSVYIKPGTYVGDISVFQPNVSLRGLGGDPTKVILTHASGSFSVTSPVSGYSYAGEFTPSISNGAQLPAGSSTFMGDEGSATLVVARGINTAVGTASLTPNNFYAENFTLQNTYDSDTSTTTTTYLSGGVCTANAGAAQTYSYLYNNAQECASQALAIWTTSDLMLSNNIYYASLQDTIYNGSQGAPVPARQYYFRGKVTGDVDYIFGDSASVFDFTSIYSAYHGTATGTVTIEAQNKANQSGGTSDYLSGDIMNSNVFTSQSSGMTSLYFGRPYGRYSTYVMLNSYVDQVAPVGYIEFSGDTNLPTSTYAEFNDIPYADPATGSPDANGVVYNGTGGSSGAGVTGTRETTSQDPGTPEAANAIKTSLSAAQATLYYPNNFLSATVSNSSSGVTNWVPTAALASAVNAFATGGAVSSILGGASVTLLMRPQTPGLGAITNGTYTIPTGTYSLTDTLNGTTTTLASGMLDASGEAYFTSSSLLAGTHNLTWTYGGDANFAGSTSSAYTLTVTGAATTTTLSTTAANNTITYGQAAPVIVTVGASSGTPTGMVTLTIDGTSTQTATLSGGTANFSVSGLAAGSHTFSATYSGATMFTASSSTSSLALTVGKAALTMTPACANRTFDQPNTCSIMSITGFQYTDSAGTVFSGAPAATTAALPNSAPGSYPVTAAYTLSTFGSSNYTVTVPAVTFTVTGNTPQNVIFAQLPNFPHGGAYQLTARATSGLAVTYSITTGSGIATISGSTLTVSGTGTVTVTATTVTDTTGEYAPSSASSTFTAQ